MAFRPLPAREVRIAGLIALLLALIALFLLLLLVRNPLGPGAVYRAIALLTALIVLAILVYRIWALRGLDYWVDRDGIRILWAGAKLIIPLSAVEAIHAPARQSSSPRNWWCWPAWWVRPWQPGEPLAAYATRPPAACHVLQLADARILISPAQPDAFIEAFHARVELGPARKLQLGLETSAWRQHWLFRDRAPLLILGAGLALGLASLAYLVWRFPTVPYQVPIHFDANGIPDRISPRRALFFLPAITLLIGFFNTLIGYVFYERERLAAYMLWGGALVLQIAGWFVLRSLLHLIVG